MELIDTIYDVSEFKPIHPCLSELEEARGHLEAAFESEGQCVARFEWGSISLPLELLDKLLNLVGWHVAILRAERYYCRVIGDD